MSNQPVVEKRGWMRTLVRWLATKYYPTIETTGSERIPQTGSVLLCANHANSLIDPVLIGIVARRPVRFMAKAPLFDNPLLGPPMRALGMIPAYRGSDDARDVRRNIESLDVGAKALVDGLAMGIFPEGKSTDQAHLEMVRSGAARMALQAVAEGADDLLVIPIGITYECKDAFRSSVWIQVGEPIDVAECLAEHDGKERVARRSLTQLLEARLKDVVVHLDEPDWEPWLDDLQSLAEAPRDANKETSPPLKRRKRIADAINYFFAKDRPRAESVADDIKAYRDHVQQAGLTIESPVLRLRGFRVFAEIAWELFCLILLFFPALAGTLQHLVPFVIVRGLAPYFDQPGRKTIATSRVFVGLPAYLLWYAVVAWWAFGYFAPWFAWTWMIAAPFCGVIAIHYWRRAGRVAQLIWHQIQVTIDRKTLLNLRQQEADLRTELRGLAEDYEEVSPRPIKEFRPSRKSQIGRIAGRALVVLLVFATLWIARYRLFDDPLSGSGLDVQQISQRRMTALVDADEQELNRLIDELDTLEARATRLQRDFNDGNRSFTNQADDDDLREVLRRYMTHREALLRIVWKYQRYAEIENEELRLRTFLLEFTAASMLYEASLKFVHQFGDRSEAVAKLNEPEPNWGIPAGLYDTIRHNLASPQNIRMFELARQYYHQEHVQQQLKTHALLTSPPYDRFHNAIEDAEATIREINDSVSARVIQVAVSDLGNLIYHAQYATQSLVSTWIGDFKIRQPHGGEPLIDKQQLAQLSEVLEPGDILLERRNWYLSNAFLPGYWPHGAVYVGTTEDLKRLGLDTNEYVSKHWHKFSANDEEGHPHVIVEAVSEGVIFSSLEHSIGGADSVAVLRPSVSEQEKKDAIVSAFSFAGRPYDFEFNFETPSMLVCTEVVFRAYGGNAGTIQFPLEEIMGRQTMPAINLARKFDEEYGNDAAQFEFVAFIDGDEVAETSRFVTDAEAFRNTVDRPASSFVQSSDPIALKSIGPLGRTLAFLTLLAAVWAVAAPLARRLRSPKLAVSNEPESTEPPPGQ
ncbi:2-acyl-glycerophospho-ethanolamine acyltransferase [Symmachiella dynata]|uniref:2-acyl-glycerophospho-ethanolamine acyltransferase n=1 Tax=Symmachiella dynata TaxID=2527995 RepID=A0A517ZIX8_9PLAN|nr:1-acyl-sn-glycerol-3-phosphate acyltransferase [Symmachiella dynata]QDU42442.1 2-acyl-glycerophospho-ethanolamine acyltransferase [Symmachiella dynata]